MWRRWGNSRDPYIGNPTLIDSTMDERYLETIPEVESLYSRRSSIATNALPELPFRAVAPLHPSQTVLEIDRTSSVYSEHSQILEDPKEESVHRSDSVRSEVSPISTPRASVDNLPVSPLISPLDAPPQFSTRFPRPEPQYKSQIPRRKIPDTNQNVQEGPAHQNAPPATEHNEQETKWDDYSGEPSSTGKPPLVSPGAAPIELQYPQLKERTRQILADLRERDKAKAQTLGKVPPLVDPASLDNPVIREPWKGASGRTPLIEPVRNTPRPEPLRIPQRNIGHQATAENSHPIRTTSVTTYESPTSVPTPISAVPAPTVISPAIPSPATIRAVASQESIKPTVPLKLGTMSPRVISPVTAENTASLQSPFRSPHYELDQSTHDAVTITIAPQHYSESPTLDTDGPETPTRPGPQQAKKSQEDISQRREVGKMLIPKDATSRFSWTTYATTANESPRSMRNPQFDSSPIPPVPLPIIVRKRPIASAQNAGIFSNIDATVSNTSVVSRKPVAAADRHRASSMFSTASLSKSLPQCPPEMEAIDKISTLEARMDDLARRKRNIGKIIKELTEGLKRNSISYDTWKRREVEKMVTNLKLELAEVGQEEHEVGIRLHRAQKKKDKEDNYEQPTGLWIKRVTS